MSILPGTDGAVLLRQGKDFALTFEATDPVTGEPRDMTGYGFRMQIRETIAAPDPIIDMAPYISLVDIAIGKAYVTVEGGITKDLGGYAPVDWIADAEFYLIGSDPESVEDAGRLTVNFEPEITR